MAATVNLEIAKSRQLAAVRRQVAIGAVGAAWGPALDQVWKFLRTQPGLRTDGHNIFVYHHPPRRGLPMNVDFGVEVTRAFATTGEVYATATPSGEVASAVHVGAYDQLRAAHDAIHAWARAQRREFAGVSWEIYGDPHEDPAKTETTVVYLLA